MEASQDNLFRLLTVFAGENLTKTLSNLETQAQGLDLSTCTSFLELSNASEDTLESAGVIKNLAGQINVVIHALGILRCLPHLLEEGETVEYLSLGAGNTGREFDLETNLRVAEFKFIHWKGGAESIRQNSVFKDFFLLAESDSEKRKYLYMLGTQHPLRFLNGGRAMNSVLSKDNRIRELFYAKYSDQFEIVSDYYQTRQDAVKIGDVSQWLPELITDKNTS